MKNHTPTYQTIPFIKWLFVFGVLFSFSGYSNYTQPKTENATLELVVLEEEKKQVIVSFQHILQRNKSQCSSYIHSASLPLLLILHHTEIAVHSLKKHTAFISLSQNQKLITILHASYSTEEDTFHFNLV